MEINFINLICICSFIFTLAFLKIFIFSITGKKPLEASFRPILIVGCDSGLGFLLAKHLRKCRFPIILTVFKAENIVHLEANLNGSNSRRGNDRHYHNEREEIPPYLCLKMDVTSHQDIRNGKELISNFLIKNEFNGLYAVVYCAGVYNLDFFELSISEGEEWKRIFHVNVFGLIDSAKAFLPLLRRHNQWLIHDHQRACPKRSADPINFSRFIIIGSILGRLGVIGNSLYCSSKSAVKIINDSISLELKTTKVHSLLIEPGAIKDTNLFNEPLNNERLTKKVKELKNKKDEFLGYNPNDLEDLHKHFVFWKDLGNSANVVCNKIYKSIITTNPSTNIVVGYDTFIWRIIANLPKSIQEKIIRFLFQQLLYWPILPTIIPLITYYLNKLYLITEKISLYV